MVSRHHRSHYERCSVCGKRFRGWSVIGGKCGRCRKKKESLTMI